MDPRFYEFYFKEDTLSLLIIILRLAKSLPSSSSSLSFYGRFSPIKPLPPPSSRPLFFRTRGVPLLYVHLFMELYIITAQPSYTYLSMLHVVVYGFTLWGIGNYKKMSRLPLMTRQRGYAPSLLSLTTCYISCKQSQFFACSSYSPLYSNGSPY